MSRLLLNIITPCTQTENLELLHESIITAKKNLPIDIVWHIVFDTLCDVVFDTLSDATSDLIKSNEMLVLTSHTGDKESVAGNIQINHALSNIEKGFIYILRDDNLIHPEILDYLYRGANSVNFGGLLVEQFLEDDEIRLIKPAPTKPISGFLDCAQFIIKTELVENLRFHLGIPNACGIFLQQIYNKHQDRFEIITKPLAYFRKVEEYRLLEKAPSSFGIGSLVTVNKDHYQNHFSKIETFMLRGTIMKLKRQFNRRMIIDNIMEETDVCFVAILPLRKSNIAWRHGKGTVLKFENKEQAAKVFTLISKNK
jgi:hypothetical protein